MSMKKLMFTLLMCASLGFVGCGNGPSNPNNNGDGGGQTCDPGCQPTEKCENGQCKPKTGDSAVCDPECKPTEKCENGTCVPDTTGGPDVKLCGNGKKDEGETCDIAASILAQKCGGAKACTDKTNGCDTYTFSLGTAGNQCTEQCSLTKITEAKNDDGCCPEGATEAEDNDCKKNYDLCEADQDCATSKYGKVCITSIGNKGYCGQWGDPTQFEAETCKAVMPDYIPVVDDQNNPTLAGCVYSCKGGVECPGDTVCDKNGFCLFPPLDRSKLPATNDFPAANKDCTQDSDCTTSVDPAERESNVQCKKEAQANPELEVTPNEGGFCELRGCADEKTGFKCPDGFTCWVLGRTGSVCLLDCDPKDAASVKKCTDAGTGNACLLLGSKGEHGCWDDDGVCESDTDCTDQAKYVCEARAASATKRCVVKGSGTKAKGDECAANETSEVCPADTYCAAKDVLKAVLGKPKDQSRFCTMNCKQDSDCTGPGGIPNTHCMDFLNNGQSFCSAVTECTTDADCSGFTAPLKCVETTFVGGTSKKKICSIPKTTP